jgi:WD40 repeat protein
LLAAEAVRRKDDLPAAKGALLGALALSDAQRLGRPGISAIAAAGDRRSLVAVEEDGVATLWKLDPGASPAAGRTFRIRGAVTALALSNDRRWLLVRDRDGDVRRLDLTKGDQGTPLPGEDWRDGDPFSSDSRWLTMDRLGTTVRHDLLRGTVTEVRGSKPEPVNARIEALSSDGRWLAWGEESGAVRLQGRELPESPPVELPGQGQRVRFLIFAAGDRWLVTQGGHEAPRLWDVGRFPPGGILAATPDGSRRVVGRPGGNVQVEGAGENHPLQGVEPGASIWALSQDGSRLAAGGPDGKLLLWKLGGGAKPRIVPGVGPLTVLAFSPQGDRLAIGGEGFAKLWDLGNRDPQLLLSDSGQRVTAVAFNPASNRLATGWRQGKVRIFRLDDPAVPMDEAATLDAPVTALAYSPDGEWLAMTDGNGKARLWKDGPGKPLDNQDPEVRVLAFSPDGRRLAGGGEAGILQLWDLGNPSGVPVAWQGHAGPVHSLSFARDGRELTTTGQSVRAWPLDAGELIRRACDKAGRGLTKEEWDGNAPQGEKLRKGTPCGAR